MGGMTNGHMIYVTFPRAGTAPLHVTYAVAGGDSQTAQDVLANEFREPEVDILYGRALSAAEIEKLGLSAGQFRSFWPTHEL